jgi:sorbitol/mannitol transport system substrate-binding protein
MTPRRRVTRVATATACLTLLSACAGAGGGGGGGEGEDGQAINVIMVNNPQMEDLQSLTAEHFTAESGITVNYTVLPENEVRDRIQQEFSSQAGQYDVASISNYEVPFFSTNGWLEPLDQYVQDDADFNQADILQPIATGLTGEDGNIYAEPFYGESSFLMYRTDVFQELGLTMPENPTWQQVADLAAQVNQARDDMAGICLRGQPGWGQLFAPLTTVVNTFGGTWFDADWNAQVNAPEFVEATQFYVDLVRAHGEPGAPQAGFTECLNNMTQGAVAMWYDATSAAGSLEAEGSPIAGKVGYVAAPVVETESSGWLYSWAWGLQAGSDNKENAAEFIKWASSQEYEELVAAELGWERVPAGKRSSTYENPEYQEAASSFYAATEAAITSADPENPGVQPRPVPGIQFMAFPEFAALATTVSQDVSGAIAGQTTVQEALDKGQAAAEEIGQKYQED